VNLGGPSSSWASWEGWQAVTLGASLEKYKLGRRQAEIWATLIIDPERAPADVKLRSLSRH